MAQEWYVIQTLPSKEQKVYESLCSRIVLEGMQDRIVEVLIPSEKVSEVRSGKKIISSRKFFPGYIFVRMEYDEETHYLVNDTPGVIGFVGSGVPPRPLDDSEIAAVLGQIEEKKEKIKPKVLYAIGEAVKVTDGPFDNMTGVVELVDPDKGKIVVRVAIFGRETPVELEYWQVEKS